MVNLERGTNSEERKMRKGNREKENKKRKMNNGGRGNGSLGPRLERNILMIMGSKRSEHQS